MLGAIGDQTISLGSALNLQLTATDPDGDLVTFLAAPLPLPSNASLSAATGLFTFSPAADQVGVVILTFFAGDGELFDSETIVITVEGAAPGGATALTGLLLDTNDFVQGIETPVVGATVSLLGTGFSTTSDASGDFTLTGIPAGSQILDIATATANLAPDGSFYAGFREEIDLIDGVTNVVGRAFFLPRIAGESLTVVDPVTTTVVTNPTLNVTITVPPNTALNPDGTLFTGALSISVVPDGLAPAALPDELQPGMLITIQPVGVTFATPVPITFSNIDNLAPGSEVDIWSLDPDTGTFVIVGTGQVSADGSVIETISGGIRATDWHAVLPPRVDGEGENNDSCQCQNKCCDIQTGSRTAVASGNLTVDHTLVSYRSLGTSRAARLIYRSLSADPQPIIPFGTTIPVRAAVPPTVSARLSVAGVDQGVEVFTDTSSLNENIDETIRQAMQFDASAIRTGLYPYRMTQTSNYAQSSISNVLTGNVLVNNQRNSPFGAGWTLDGLARLHIQADQSILLADGDGSLLHFAPASSATYSEDFEGTVGPEWSTTATDTTPSGRRFLGQFGNTTATLTRAALPLHTDITVTFDLYIIQSWDGNPAGVGPDEWDLTVSGGPTLLHTTFSKGQRQAFPDTFPGGDNPAFTGAAELNSLGYTFFGDAVYSLSFTFPHTASSLALDFSASGLQSLSDESWGLDNVSLTILPALATNDFRGPPGDFSAITKNDDGTFTRTLKGGTRIHFDANGLQTSVVDRNGNTTTYTYDASDNLIAITDPVGLVTSFTVGSTLMSVTGPAGRTTTFEHDADGNLTRITDPDGSTRQFAYDARHRLISQTSKRGFDTTYTYNFAGRNVLATRPDGSTNAVSPSATVGLVDPASGLGTQANPAPVVRPQDVVSTFTDGNGNVTTYGTDRFGAGNETTDALGRQTSVTRDGNSNPTQMVNPNGATTTIAYDGRGNLLTLTEAVGTLLERISSFEYEPGFSQITRITDPASKVTTLDYDAQGNLIRTTDPLGGQFFLTYNGYGLPLTTTDQNGNNTIFNYDARINLTTVTDPLGNATNITLDAAGNMAALTEGAGSPQERTSTLIYDALNRVLTVTDGAGGVTELTYDAAGNVLTATNPTGQATTFTYDARNRVSSVNDPVSGITQFSYDGEGNLIFTVDALGNSTSNEYDAGNQLVRSIDALGGVQVLTYDNHGNPLSFGDAKGQSTTFEYDLLDRQIQKTQPLNRVTTFSYDSRDNLTGSTDPKGQMLTLAYDDVSRLTNITTADNTITSTYDAASNLLTLTDNDSGLAFSYDALHRALTADTVDVGVQPPVTLTNSFDSVGNNSQLADSEGGLTQFSYDAVDRLIQLVTPAMDTISLSSDLAGRQTLIQFPNGVTSDFQYDVNGRLANLTHSTAGGMVLAGFGFTYNAVGNILSIAETAKVRQFSYDALQRVAAGGTVAVPETYAYDAVGNRTTSFLSVIHTHDAANRLLNDDAFSYSYDANGNLISKIANSDSAVTTFIWNAQNQLVQIDFPDATQATYRYDGFGRRIEKNVNGAITRYVYAGLHILLEYDGTNTLVARYSHGDKIDQPLSMERDGQRFFYQTDHLGSIRKLTDTAGSVVNSYDYDSYGNIETTLQGVANPFTYNGRERDAESGLYYYRTRYYDAQTGRFISEDSIGFAGGDGNLFRYVKGNPVNFIDPAGTGEHPGVILDVVTAHDVPLHGLSDVLGLGTAVATGGSAAERYVGGGVNRAAVRTAARRAANLGALRFLGPVGLAVGVATDLVTIARAINEGIGALQALQGAINSERQAALSQLRLALFRVGQKVVGNCPSAKSLRNQFDSFERLLSRAISSDSRVSSSNKAKIQTLLNGGRVITTTGPLIGPVSP